MLVQSLEYIQPQYNLDAISKHYMVIFKPYYFTRLLTPLHDLVGMFQTRKTDVINVMA